MAARTQKTGAGDEKKPKASKSTPAAKKPRKTAQNAPQHEMPENIWEMLPTENADQYAKFALYRDMAYQDAPEAVDEKGRVRYGRRLKKRSLRKLAAELGLKAARPLEELSVKFDWQSRCEAYDQDLDRRARQAQEEAVIKMREDHALLGAQMIRKATSRLLRIPEEEISAGDLIRLADVGVKIERLSRGESTENQNVSGTLAHQGTVKVSLETQASLKDLSDEELTQLEQLLGKIHQKPGV
ncbi:MAG: hypothetical protein LUD19_03540 [Clostridia bacterium]|nr:hypothetical protein [Clostridia bacterium]